MCSLVRNMLEYYQCLKNEKVASEGSKNSSLGYTEYLCLKTKSLNLLATFSAVFKLMVGQHTVWSGSILKVMTRMSLTKSTNKSNHFSSIMAPLATTNPSQLMSNHCERGSRSAPEKPGVLSFVFAVLLEQ